MKQIRIPFIIGLIFLITFIGCNHPSRQQKMFNHPNCENYFQIKRGINISHWLSQNPDKNSNRNRLFTVEDAALISRLGYDHVRIPVDEEHLWDEQGNRLESSFEMLHEGIKWCLENDLKIILDLHQIRSHSFNSRNNLLWKSAKAQNEFIQMWLLLSGEFSKYPVEDLAYELLNEAVADSSSQWNRLLKTTIDSIRKREPYRKIIFGSNKWQTPKTFHELVVPENDSNIILSFHFYAPHAFTHYRAHWLEAGKYIGPVNYPGQVIEPENLTGYPENVLKGINQSNGYYTKDTLLGNIQEPLLYAKEHRLQLYCGEFGCVPFVPRTMRLQWYKDVREMFEMNGIAWSNWDYKGLFGIFNSGNGNPDQYLMDVLIPE